MLPKVYIEIEPFLVMIWAAVEEFRKECLGFILGYRPTPKDNNFYITAVFPLQSVRRGRKGKALGEVEQTKHGRKRFKEFGKWLEAGRILKIGDFHSHTEYRGILPPAELSGSDKKSMEENEIEIIISISSRKKGKAPWEALSDGRVTGSFGKYNFLFGVHMLEKKIDDGDDRILEQKTVKNTDLLQIVAPSAIKALNRIQLKL